MALLFAVLGGLFLMHGLSGHGAMHHAGSAGVAMFHAASATGDTMGHATGVATVHAAAVVAASPDLPSVAAPEHGGGHGSSFAELCMAVLAGGLLLALLTRRGGITAVVRARRTHRDAGAPAFAGSPPDPPDLQRLSISRC